MGDIPPQMSLAEACLWFSITNLTTVGYGSMVPGSRTANIICTLEHFTGIVMSSLLLGVVVMKASMPTAKIVFSSHALMTQRNGVPHMLVRAGNTRGNFLLNPEIRIAYLRRVVTQEGEVTFLPLKMEFVDPPAMAPCVNIAHQVDEHSPLYGKSAADIKAEEGAVYVSVSATDDNFLQTVYARTVYRFDDIKWNHRFVDVLMQKGGRQCVDFRKFHDLCDLSDPQAQATLRSNSNKAPSLVGNGLEASPQKPSSHSPLGSVRKRVGVLFKSRPAMYH
ncbi:hypothetical protein WJX72_011464 [[Myrmecia] bisecta]|uniref:Inward rectifier potassium channel C-terminal domain-containing protein n=1 Tax=[Myrmecia] bisecta TaxID=41462 RepID=A0AAW1PD01_9CHLO